MVKLAEHHRKEIRRLMGAVQINITDLASAAGVGRNRLSQFLNHEEISPSLRWLDLVYAPLLKRVRTMKRAGQWLLPSPNRKESDT